MRTWLQYFLELVIVMAATNWVIRGAGILALFVTTYFWVHSRGGV